VAQVEQRLIDMGVELPAEVQLPPGVEIPFSWVRVHGDRCLVSGHGALTADGSPAGPIGTVPADVPLEQAQESARLATLTMFASLRSHLGDLDRVDAWLIVNGHVNAEPGYPHTTLVMNPCSELILAAFGSDVGAHARTAIGATTVPLNLPVVVSAQLAIRP
jgi:enamine deaminase RidA (YjgF/YER057c/UK114 family)